MNLTILLIEDNEQNRYLTTFLLEKHGHKVTSAPDGISGVEMARTLRPDLILLDIQLPRMDGYSVAQALRGIEPLRDTTDRRRDPPTRWWATARNASPRAAMVI